jgi:hypothetical protein
LFTLSHSLPWKLALLNRFLVHMPKSFDFHYMATIGVLNFGVVIPPRDSTGTVHRYMCQWALMHLVVWVLVLHDLLTVFFFDICQGRDCVINRNKANFHWTVRAWYDTSQRPSSASRRAPRSRPGTRDWHFCVNAVLIGTVPPEHRSHGP